MAVFNRKLLIGFFVLAPMLLQGGDEIFNRVFRQRDVRVGEQIFSTQTDIVNGVKTKKWLIDGILMEKNAFHEALIIAETDEVKRKIAEEEAAEQEEQELAIVVREAVATKLLSAEVALWEHELAKIKAHGLDQFFTFSSGTIASHEDYERLITVSLPAAKALLTAARGSEAINEALQAYRDLEIHTAGLKKLVRLAIKDAVNRSTDTKKLKGLLQLGGAA
ncbi:MAG: hypothetical protein JW725_00370 [Candidatus Babeliaceae bacterium]|nr:hypothetical protein [Candidatus Babeliaceae bacterium]